MKKILLFCLVGLFGVSLLAQQRIPLSKEQSKRAKMFQNLEVRDVVSPIVQQNAAPRVQGLVNWM